MSKTYIEFKLIKKKCKTNIYGVYNINSGLRLGIIKWYRFLRQYCFFPANRIIAGRDCMKDIIDFINKITEERKKS